jgi:cytidylate kinase
MQGEIIKILEKKSKYGSDYFDVHFKLLESGSFYRSCIYTACRNYSHWKDFLKIGNVFSNLNLTLKYGKYFIDADCKPELIRNGNTEILKVNPIKKQNHNLQMSLF